MGLLFVLFLLWRSTRSDALPMESATPQPSAPVAATEPPPAAPAAPPPRPAARVGKVGGTATASPSRGASGPAPALTPAPQIAEAPKREPSNSDNLHFGGAQLRAQTAAVEPLVRECVEKAVTSGLRPSGKAVMTYVVEKQGEKYVVEDTGFDSEETTLQNQGLVECLHRTARAMKFEGLPRRAESILVTRSVTLEDGAVSEYKHVTFTYMR
jgi:hypothetical protein